MPPAHCIEWIKSNCIKLIGKITLDENKRECIKSKKRLYWIHKKRYIQLMKKIKLDKPINIALNK